MYRYLVPKVVCAMSTLVFFTIFLLSELNLTLGNYRKSFIFAAGITTVLLLFAYMAFKMKTAHRKKIKRVKCRILEYLSLVIFVLIGLFSLLVFNHSITVCLQRSTIQKELNIRQLEKMFPDYETYANQRIANYTSLLNETILYKGMRKSEFTNLGFSYKSVETIESQRDRKLNKLKQILYPPEIYEDLKKRIIDSISVFIDKVESLGTIATLPKQINPIIQNTQSWVNQLRNFSHSKMKGETAEEFQFKSTFGNVKKIMTYSADFFSPKRYVGYVVGIFLLLLMLFPYFFGIRSIKIYRNSK